MYKILATTAVLAMSTTLPGAASGPQLSFEEAVDVCTTRAVRFGRTVYGRGADEPPAQLVQDRYKSCVYAYSKQYPTRKVEYRDTVFRVQKILE